MYCLGFVSISFYPSFFPTIKAKREKEQHPRLPDNLHCERPSPAPSLAGIRIRLLASFEERVAFLQALRTQGGHARYHSRWDTTPFWSLLLTRSSHGRRTPPCLFDSVFAQENESLADGNHAWRCAWSSTLQILTLFSDFQFFYFTLNFPCEYRSKSGGYGWP